MFKISETPTNTARIIKNSRVDEEDKQYGVGEGRIHNKCLFHVESWREGVAGGGDMSFFLKSSLLSPMFMYFSLVVFTHRGHEFIGANK